MSAKILKVMLFTLHGVLCMSHAILKEQGGNLLSVFLSAPWSLHISLEQMLPRRLSCCKLTQNKGYYVCGRMLVQAYSQEVDVGWSRENHSLCLRRNNSYSAQHSGSLRVYVQGCPFSVDINIQMYVYEAHSQIFFFSSWLILFEKETPSFQTGSDVPGYSCASTFCLCGKLGDF